MLSEEEIINMAQEITYLEAQCNALREQCKRTTEMNTRLLALSVALMESNKKAVAVINALSQQNTCKYVTPDRRAHADDKIKSESLNRKALKFSAYDAHAGKRKRTTSVAAGLEFVAYEGQGPQRSDKKFKKY